MSLLLLNANSLHIPLADKSVHCAVTSPPYWGLRDYGTATWIGGDAGCDHQPAQTQGKTGQRSDRTFTAVEPFKDTCLKCGAVCVDAQLGLEAVPDCLGWATGSPCGVCYICHTVAWAREVKRVLRDDGTMWINLGDSYASSWASGRRNIIGNPSRTNRVDRRPDGLKEKDLCGIPWRVAFALQADGWWLRSDIIWSKPNPMPESVTDRPTKAHEYLFLLAKSERYYYDADAVREGFDTPLHRPGNVVAKGVVQRNDFGTDRMDATWGNPAGRNRRTVWTIATAPYSGAHFATYPPALVEPCIKAGTSERGCCPKCGKGWRRETERTNESNWEFRKSMGATGGAMQMGPKQQIGSGWSHNLPTRQNDTIGFAPACTCPAADPVPCTVLDPFAGSGTTLMVARSLGRNAVGLDLSYAYLRDQARSRLDLDRLDAWVSGKRDGASIQDLPLFSEMP